MNPNQTFIILPKTLLTGVFILCFNLFAQSQDETPTEGNHAILEIYIPGFKTDEFEIKVYYGDENIEDVAQFRYRDKDLLPNYIVNALNMLHKKEYELISTIQVGQMVYYNLSKKKE